MFTRLFSTKLLLLYKKNCCEFVICEALKGGVVARAELEVSHVCVLMTAAIPGTGDMAHPSSHSHRVTPTSQLAITSKCAMNFSFDIRTT